MKDILLITPPFTQLNTPYPATAYLKGFLNTKYISSYQLDLGIEVILELFSKKGLSKVFDQTIENQSDLSENAERIYSLKDDYLKTIEDVISFLQGHNPTYARNICTDNTLPEASRFAQLDDLEWAFGTMGMQDKAKHLATLYLEDLSDFIKECIDENFGFSRYAERLGQSANTFDELHNKLQGPTSFVDDITLALLKTHVAEVQPKLVCISVPFPGNLYSAFRCAQFIKDHFPTIKISMGGGFPNTELRSLKDIRVFNYFDYITLDDGELPVELLFQQIYKPKNNPEFKRTFTTVEGSVQYINNSKTPDYKQSQVGTPDYSDLLLDKYISVIEIANPMHSLWSDGRWNKLTMAHGCYWGKCTFCDISLDYIKVYEPIAAKLIVDRVEELIAQTGERGFHFVDEAAPPALMREVALEIIKRDLVITWWTNIRFEKSFTQDLCVLLKSSGCVAVSGGLEVASDRLLALIDKGVTVEQVAQVTRNFTDAGIMVHSYLMYGYPTQTVQETVDSLEMVRQLFELGIIQSGFWHQFALTAHSPVGLDPESYHIVPNQKEITFANNDIQFKDNTGIDHDQFSFGLKKSLFNYMHGICFEYELQEWFDFDIPETTIAEDYIENCLLNEESSKPQPSAKVVWLGGKPIVSIISKQKKGLPKDYLEMIFHDKKEVVTISLEKSQGEWFMDILKTIAINNYSPLTFGELRADFEKRFEYFDMFWNSQYLRQMRSIGLLVV